jgi:hypothetical protein
VVSVRNRRVLAWLGVAAVVTAVGVAIFCFGVLPARRTALVWPAQGLVVVPGSAEEAAASFAASLSRGEYDAIAARFTKRFGPVNPADIANSVKASLGSVGRLEKWLLVASSPGDPVTVTAYSHFTRKGNQIMTIEVYREDSEWRFGNIRLRSPSAASWKPPAWLEVETDRLRLRVWPGHDADLGTLKDRGEFGFSQALGPLAAGAGSATGGPTQAPLPAGLTDKVSVWVYDSLVSLSAATGQGYPDWFVGTVTGDGVIILSSEAMARNNPPKDLYTIFVHELNHCLLSRYVAATGGQLLSDLPAWLAEGLAGLAAHQLSDPAAFLSSLPASPAPLPSLAEVALGFGPSQMPLRYPYAFSAVEYLAHAHGADAPRHLIDFICAGATPEEAITKLTGLSVKDFEAAWHAWLRAGMP